MMSKQKTINDELKLIAQPPPYGLTHFIQNWLTLEGKPFKLDDYQFEMAKDLGRFRIVNKSKKVGMSTYITAEGLWYALVEEGIDVVYISTGQRMANELFTRVKDHIDNMKEPFRKIIKKLLVHDRGGLLQFSHTNARVFSLPNSPATIVGLGMRGRTRVYLDEQAYIENDEDLWKAVYPFTIIGDGNITAISTPKGRSGKFHEIAGELQAIKQGLLEAKPSIWNYHEIPWYRCPRLRASIDIIAEECGGIESITFKENHCCIFVDESVSLFPWALIYNEEIIDDKLETYPNGLKTSNAFSFGIDLAKKRDETAIVGVEKLGKTFFVRYLHFFAKTDYDVQVPFISSLGSSFDGNPFFVKIDQQGNEYLFETLSKPDKLGSKVFGYMFTPGFKEKTVMNMLSIFQNKLIKIPKNDPNTMKLLSQLHSVERIVTQHGHARYSGKATGLDDFVWALALALWDDYQTDGEAFLETDQDSFIKSIGSTKMEVPQYIEEEEQILLV